MNAMFAAIRKRQGKGGDHSATHVGYHDDKQDQPSPGGGKDLHGLVAGLDDHEKVKLKQILNQEVGNGQAIAHGAPSTEEQGKIAARSAEENQEHALEESPEPGEGGISEEQSDDIGKSLLDSRHLRGMATEKPRNLNERMKQHVSSKLKAKGKI